jgi:uncharacterized protein
MEMKSKLFIALLIVLPVVMSCHSTKTQKEFVFDKAKVLDSMQFQKLNDLYIRHEKLTTNELALLTTNSFAPVNTIEEYAHERFNTLGLGKKDIDNGILIVFSPEMRQVRIATGYGTERVLTDSIAKRIIDSVMIPQFRRVNYFEGLWDGSLAITRFLEKPENTIK